MNYFISRLSILTILLMIFSCKLSNPKDDLIGEFSSKEGGTGELRITKEEGKYFASMLNGGNWSAPYPLEDVKEDDYVKIFGDDWKSYVDAGMQGDGVGIFKVNKGHQYKNHTFHSGYYILIGVLGGADIYKL